MNILKESIVREKRGEMEVEMTPIKSHNEDVPKDIMESYRILE